MRIEVLIIYEGDAMQSSKPERWEMVKRLRSLAGCEVGRHIYGAKEFDEYLLDGGEMPSDG